MVKALSPDERQLLTDLTQHPGWRILTRILKEQAEQRAQAMAKLLLFTDEEIDLDRLRYDRGYYKAMFDLVAKPERAAALKTNKE